MDRDRHSPLSWNSVAMASLGALLLSGVLAACVPTPTPPKTPEEPVGLSTLAGTGEAGRADGALSTATLTKPFRVAVSKDGSKVAVVEPDDVRVVDVVTNQVSTWVAAPNVTNPRRAIFTDSGDLIVADRRPDGTGALLRVTATGSIVEILSGYRTSDYMPLTLSPNGLRIYTSVKVSEKKLDSVYRLTDHIASIPIDGGELVDEGRHSYAQDGFVEWSEYADFDFSPTGVFYAIFTRAISVRGYYYQPAIMTGIPGSSSGRLATRATEIYRGRQIAFSPSGVAFGVTAQTASAYLRLVNTVAYEAAPCASNPPYSYAVGGCGKGFLDGQPGMMNEASDIASSPSGVFYIADTENNRIRRLVPPPLATSPVCYETRWACADHAGAPATIPTYKDFADTATWNSEFSVRYQGIAGRQHVVQLSEGYEAKDFERAIVFESTPQSSLASVGFVGVPKHLLRNSQTAWLRVGSVLNGVKSFGPPVPIHVGEAWTVTDRIENFRSFGTFPVVNSGSMIFGPPTYDSDNPGFEYGTVGFVLRDSALPPSALPDRLVTNQHVSGPAVPYRALPNLREARNRIYQLDVLADNTLVRRRIGVVVISSSVPDASGVDLDPWMQARSGIQYSAQVVPNAPLFTAPASIEEDPFLNGISDPLASPSIPPTELHHAGTSSVRIKSGPFDSRTSSSGCGAQQYTAKFEVIPGDSGGPVWKSTSSDPTVSPVIVGLATCGAEGEHYGGFEAVKRVLDVVDPDRRFVLVP